MTESDTLKSLAFIKKKLNLYQRQNESGSALIAVFWILLLLSVMSLGYASSTRLRVVAATNQIKTIKRGYEVKSLQQLGLFEYTKYLKNRSLFSRREEIEMMTGNRVDLWSPRYEPYIASGDNSDEPSTRDSLLGNMAVQIRCEEARYNINTITSELLERILVLCGQNDQEQRRQIKDALLDWIDTDNLHHLQGAETEDYLENQPAYYCKNNKIQAIEELLLIRGITAEMYYGDDNHAGLIDLLSVYNTQQKIDIHSASPAAFGLIEHLTHEEKNEILAYRKSNPLAIIKDFAGIVTPEVYSQLQRYFTIVQAPAFVTVSVSSWPTPLEPLQWQHKTYRIK